MLADKLNLVKKNIEEACDTAGRSPQEVTLIAVSYTHLDVYKRQVPIHCKLYYINSKKQQRKSGIS